MDDSAALKQEQELQQYERIRAMENAQRLPPAAASASGNRGTLAARAAKWRDSGAARVLEEKMAEVLGNRRVYVGHGPANQKKTAKKGGARKNRKTRRLKKRKGCKNGPA
jgi:hypothetical protein